MVIESLRCTPGELASSSSLVGLATCLEISRQQPVSLIPIILFQFTQFCHMRVVSSRNHYHLPRCLVKQLMALITIPLPPKGWNYFGWPTIQLWRRSFEEQNGSSIRVGFLCMGIVGNCYRLSIAWRTRNESPRVSIR